MRRWPRVGLRVEPAHGVLGAFSKSVFKQEGNVYREFSFIRRVRCRAMAGHVFAGVPDWRQLERDTRASVGAPWPKGRPRTNTGG